MTDERTEMPELVEGMDERLDRLEEYSEMSDTATAERRAREVQREVSDLMEDLERVGTSLQKYDEKTRDYVEEWIERLDDTLEEIDNNTDVSIEYDTLHKGDIIINAEGGESKSQWTRRTAITAGVAGGAAGLAAAQSGFLGGFLGAVLPGFFGSNEQEGFVNNNDFQIAWDELGNDRYQIISEDGAYELWNNNEGTEFAGIDVNYDPENRSTFRNILIDDEEVDGEWENYDNLEQLIEDYEAAIQVGNEDTLDDSTAEYLIEISEAENPEEIKYEDFI